MTRACDLGGERLERLARVGHDRGGHRIVPADLERLDVDLQERLAVGVEQLGILEARVGRRQARADHEHGVGARHHLVGRRLPPVAEHAERERVRLRHRALAGRRGGDGNAGGLGQARERRPGARGVHPVAGEDHGAGGAERSASATRATSAAAGRATPCAR